LTERVTLANSLESPDVEAIEWPVAIARWGAYLEKTLRRYPATLTKNRIRMEAFSRSLPWKFVHETKPDHVERWILREGITPRTQITDGSVVRSFFRFAQKRRWCGPSPMEVDLTELSHQSGPAERPRILTPEQCQALLSAASTHFDGELLPFVLLSTWCFMRKAEVCRTTVEDINIAAARIEISPRKQGTPSYRFVNIPPNAIAILNGCVDRKLLQQKTPIAYNRSRFDKLREIAGLWTLGPRTKKRGRRSVTTSIWQENILRHTGISYLYQENGDVREVCRQAGNSSDTAFKHYLHLPEPGAAKKFFSATV
jgi:integrase